MKTVLFIPTASVYDGHPSEWLAQRLDAAIEYHNAHKGKECFFVIAGRWKNVTDFFTHTEAEVAKQYVLNVLPEAQVIKEEISVETGGNFAFSKPLIRFLQPERVVIFNSKVNEARTRFFASKVFGTEFSVEFVFIDDSFSHNERTQKKEPKALGMFQRLFENVYDGDDVNVREVLLHKTPFYMKGLIDDREFFDRYWPGGYEDFCEKRLSIDNK